MTQTQNKSQQKSVQILEILNDTYDSIMSIMMSEEFTCPQHAKRAEERKAKTNAIKKKINHIPSVDKRGMKATYDLRIKPEHQKAIIKAINIAGSVHNLGKLSGCLPIRIYEITQGKCKNIGVKLAYQIEMGTNGQVKAHELTDKVKQDVDMP